MIAIQDHTFLIAKERDIRVSNELMSIVLEYQVMRDVLHDLVQGGHKKEALELIDRMDELSEKAQQIICSPFN